MALPPEPPQPAAPPAPPVPPTPENTAWAQQINATPSASSLVNNWFSANPNATQADAASAVQSIGGLTPDLVSALANHYGTTADVVNNAYSQLTSSTPTPVNTASSPLSSGNNSTSNSSPIATPSYTQYTPDQIQTYLTNNPGINVALAEQKTNADPSVVASVISGMAPVANNPLASIVANNVKPTYTNAEISADANAILNNGGTYADVAKELDAKGVTPTQLATALNINPAYVQNQYNIANPTGSQVSAYSSSTAPSTGSDTSAQFNTTYNALQFGNTKVVNQGVDENLVPQYGLVDSSGKPLPAVPLDLGNGIYDLQVGSGGGLIHIYTRINADGTLDPVTDYKQQVDYTGGLKGGFVNQTAQAIGNMGPVLAMAAPVFSEALPILNTTLSGANTINAANNHNPIGALLSGVNTALSLNGVGPVTDSSPLSQSTVDALKIAKNGLAVANAVNTKNVPGLVSSVLSATGTPVDPLISKIFTGINIATAIAKGDMSGVVNGAMSLAKSSDPIIKEAAQKVVDATNSGDQGIIASASAYLGKLLNSDSPSASGSDSTSTGTSPLASTTPTYSQLYNYAMSQTDKNGNPITPQMAELFALNGGQGSMTNTMLDLGTVGGYPNGMPIVPPTTLGSSGVGTTPNVNNGGTNAPSYIPLDKLDVGNPLVTNATNAINTAIDKNGVPEGTDLSGGTYVKSENDPDTGQTIFSVQKPISFTNPDGQSTGYTIMYEPTSGKTMYVYQQYNSDTQNWTIVQSTQPPIFNDQSQQFDNIKPLDVPPDVKDNQLSTSNATTPSPLANSGITPNATVDVNSKVNSPLVTDKPISNTVVPDIVSPFATQSGSSGTSKVPSNISGLSGLSGASTTSPNGASPLVGGIVSNTNPNYNNFGVAPTASPTPNGTPTPSPLAPNGTPNATPVAPTATPVAPTPTPTSTPTPTPSSTPTPTSSPTPTPTSSPTPTPTPTPTPSQSTASTSVGGIPKKDAALAMVATMLGGAPVYGKQAHLQQLKQLYESLDPGLAKLLAKEGINAPKQQQNSEEPTPEQLAEINKEIKSEQPPIAEQMLMADGGSTFQDLVKQTEYKNIAPVAPTMLKEAPVIQQESRLSPLHHLKQGIRRDAPSTSLLAHGGVPHKYREASPKGHNPEFITGLTGYYASGRGTGQSDDIPAMLHDGDYVMDADTVASFGDGSSKAGAQVMDKFHHMVPHNMSEGGSPVPAKIADGEYVFPESFVTALGGGDNKLGSKLLDTMREEIRAHKRSAPDTKIPPKAKSPLQYLSEAKKQGIERK